jgi:integrase
VLLLRFAEQTLGKPATAVELSDLQPKFIAGFLDHLERERGNSPRSRNIRLAALRSFLKFAAHRDVASLSVIEQALAVPMKRFERKMVGFLTRKQMLAVIDVPTATWLGQRDHLLLTTDVQHRRQGVGDHRRAGGQTWSSATTSCVRLHGKGRKQRSLPLWKATAREVRDWLRLNPHLEAGSALLSRRDGGPMTRANVTQRLKLAVAAATACQNWASCRYRLTWFATRPRWACCRRAQLPPTSPLWLGHESPSTTHMYVEADLAMKERTLARLKPPGGQASPVPAAQGADGSSCSRCDHAK